MNKLKIYNSKTAKIEDFVALDPKVVKLYWCGPTVYNHIHIGNARPIVVFDLLKRVLEADGYLVDYVSNITDVDDRIINKALEEGLSEAEVTSRYLTAYLKLKEDLHAEKLTAMPQVMATMDKIIVFVQKLLEEGYAYQVDGDVYFRVSKISDYGEFSHQDLSELEVGARIEENSKKENPLDFALWKKTEIGIKWDAPFGSGRPGWHTECVVMITDHFGGKIDIHGGGIDLRFPHHENEVAQAKAIYHHDLANYWVYNDMVNINGEKMSKSLGNVVLAQEIVDKLGANQTIWILLGAHYRAVLQFSDELITQAERELTKIRQAEKQARLKLSLADYQQENYDLESYQEFLDCLNDDLNTPNAYMVIFKIVKEINELNRRVDADLPTLSKKVEALQRMLALLGIVYPKWHFDSEDRLLYESWQKAKAEKDFVTADEYRQQLSAKDII